MHEKSLLTFAFKWFKDSEEIISEDVSPYCIVHATEIASPMLCCEMLLHCSMACFRSKCATVLHYVLYLQWPAVLLNFDYSSDPKYIAR